MTTDMAFNSDVTFKIWWKTVPWVWICLKLSYFSSSSGTPINKRPVLGYRNLNLFKLYRLVHKLGGFDNVSAPKTGTPAAAVGLWPHLSHAMLLPLLHVWADWKWLRLEAGLPGSWHPCAQLSRWLQCQMCLPQVSTDAAFTAPRSFWADVAFVCVIFLQDRFAVFSLSFWVSLVQFFTAYTSATSAISSARCDVTGILCLINQVLVWIWGILHLHCHHLQDGPPFKAGSEERSEAWGGSGRNSGHILQLWGANGPAGWRTSQCTSSGLQGDFHVIAISFKSLHSFPNATEQSSR